jgi:GH35 family endo-1,4-beta-xylanase
VEGCLEVGIKFDAIGLQSHMHQGYWGVEKTLKSWNASADSTCLCISLKPRWFPAI